MKIMKKQMEKQEQLIKNNVKSCKTLQNNENQLKAIKRIKTSKT